MTPDEVPVWPEITATVAPTGNGEVTMNGVSYPISAPTLDAGRNAVREWVRTSAAAPLGRPVRLHSTDPTGQWDLVIDPDPTVPPRDITPPARLRRQAEALAGQEEPQATPAAAEDSAPGPEAAAEPPSFDMTVTGPPGVVDMTITGPPGVADATAQSTPTMAFAAPLPPAPGGFWPAPAPQPAAPEVQAPAPALPQAPPLDPAQPRMWEQPDPPPMTGAVPPPPATFYPPAPGPQPPAPGSQPPGPQPPAALVNAPGQAPVLETPPPELMHAPPMVWGQQPTGQESPGQAFGPPPSAPHPRASTPEQLPTVEMTAPPQADPPIEAAPPVMQLPPATMPPPGTVLPLQTPPQTAAPGGPPSPVTFGPAPGGPPVVTAEPPPGGSFVRQASPIPQKGARHALYKATAGLLNLGPGAAERFLDDLVARVRTHLEGTHNVTVTCLKGGIGKTTTTLGLGLTLAAYRADQVLALDMNPDAGDLADRALGQGRVEANAPRTISDVLAAIHGGQVSAWTDLNRYTQVAERLHLIAGDQSPDVSESITTEDYLAIRGVVDRFYPLTITDTGTGVTHPAMRGILDRTDQIVVAGGWTVSGATRASRTLTWLADQPEYRDLASRAIVVLTESSRVPRDIDRDQIVKTLGALCRDIHLVPFDLALSRGDVIRIDDLGKQTRLAYLGLAAAVVDGLREDR